MGDPLRARVIRLVGDALVAKSLFGIEEAAAGVTDELIDYLTAPRASRPIAILLMLSGIAVGSIPFWLL